MNKKVIFTLVVFLFLIVGISYFAYAVNCCDSEEKCCCRKKRHVVIEYSCTCAGGELVTQECTFLEI